MVKKKKIVRVVKNVIIFLLYIVMKVNFYRFFLKEYKLFTVYMKIEIRIFRISIIIVEI